MRFGRMLTGCRREDNREGSGNSGYIPCFRGIDITALFGYPIKVLDPWGAHAGRTENEGMAQRWL
jgi:hypothetical protein